MTLIMPRTPTSSTRSGCAVEEFRAVDEGEMMHLVHALARLCSTAAASRISPAMNSMSLSTSVSRRGLPRELSSSTRTRWPARTSAFTSAGADEAAAAGDQNTAHARSSFWRRRRDVDPARRSDASAALHRSAFARDSLRQSRAQPGLRFRSHRGRSWPAATPAQCGRPGYCRVDRILDRNALEAPPAAWRETIRSRACSRRPDCAARACRPRRRIRYGGRCRDRTRSSSTGSPAALMRTASPSRRSFPARGHPASRQRAPTARRSARRTIRDSESNG